MGEAIHRSTRLQDCTKHYTSVMKLEINGKASSSKRTRDFDIRIFYIKDLVDRGEVIIVYCPTDEMIADYMTKPTVGSKFKMLRD